MPSHLRWKWIVVLAVVLGCVFGIVELPKSQRTHHPTKSVLPDGPRDWLEYYRRSTYVDRLLDERQNRRV